MQPGFKTSEFTVMVQKTSIAQIWTLAALVLLTFFSLTVHADSSGIVGDTSSLQSSSEASDEVLWGYSGTELAIGGSVAATAATARYGLYQIAKGGESVAAVVTALIAIELASLAILGGLVLKGGLAAFYLWPADDQSPDSIELLPGQKSLDESAGSVSKGTLTAF